MLDWARARVSTDALNEIAANATYTCDQSRCIVVLSIRSRTARMAPCICRENCTCIRLTAGGRHGEDYRTRVLTRTDYLDSPGGVGQGSGARLCSHTQLSAAGPAPGRTRPG